MGIKSDFNEARSMEDLNKQTEVLYDKIIKAFIMAGEKFVKDAREQMQDHAMGTYKDQTKNLRNSIGYIIFSKGERVHSNIGPEANELGGILEDMKSEGIQLIGFAGMNYASYVESKGYNVISYQADTCMVDLAVYLENHDLIEPGTAAGIEETFLP
jgi:hypothetical protein